MQLARQNYRLQQWITVLSALLFIAKIIAYYATHSLAVLSDALESIVNVIASVIGLISLNIAAKPKDAGHPFGHGKAEFISSGIEGALITASGIFIIYEAVYSFFKYEEIVRIDVGLIIIAVTAIINYIAGTICLRTGRKNNSLALQSTGRHLQLDTWSSLLILLTLGLMLLSHIYWLDKVVAIAIGFIVIWNGYKIIRKSFAAIMDEADINLLEKIVALLNKHRSENWIDLHNLRVIKYGVVLHIDFHVTMPWYLNMHEAHKEIDILTNLINKEFGGYAEFSIHTDACMDFSCSICSKQFCMVRQQKFIQLIDWTPDKISSNEKHHL